MRRKFRSRAWFFCVFAVALSLLTTVMRPSRAQERPNPPAAAGGAEGDKPRAFGPGVRIDWKARAVEVDGEIVLRAGPLELFACSPRTKEHESIVAVRARPLHIFQAMGLLGFEPGSPMRYDEEARKWLPPTGDALELRVRFRRDDEERVVPLERWLLDSKRHRPPDPIRWVFAGSRVFDDGEFAADDEGTVICVVDFESALITVGALHTADNEELWLVANTEEIPPVGTPVSILIRSIEPPRVDVELTSAGEFRHDGKPLSAGDVAKLVNDAQTRGARSALVLRAAADAADEAVHGAIARLVEAGLDRKLINVRRGSAKPSSPAP